MNVLHINCNYITTKLHSIMIEHLNKEGINNKVFVPTYNKKISVINIDEKTEKVVECFKKNDRFLYYLKQSKIYNAAKKSFNISEFDIIHAYTLFTDGNCAMKLSKKYSIPYVVAIRNTDINTFFKYRFYLRKRGIKILKNSSAIFFLSNSYKEQLFNKYIPSKYKNEFENKAHIIPNGIDDFWFDNLNKDNDIEKKLKELNNKELKIIYAGNIDKNKNINATCEAIEKLKEEGWKTTFIVAGKIKDKKVYNKIKDEIDYKGILTKEELINYYRKSHIFVMPSHKETFGLVYAEAMSQGLPVIYTKGQGFDGQFDEGQVGYRVNINGENEVIEAMEKICNNYINISNNCVDLVNKFEWRKICKRYYEIYKFILI